MNRITVLSRFSRVPTVTRSVHNVNFAKKTTQFLADLKKQEEAKIQEIDLELTYLKNDLRDVRKIVNSLQTLPAQKETITGDYLASLFQSEKLIDNRNAFDMKELYKQTEEAIQLERTDKMEEMYQAVNLIHTYCNILNLRSEASQGVDPLLRTESEFPKLYLLPIHLAKTLNSAKNGTKEETLQNCEKLRTEIQRLQKATDARIAELKQREIELTAMTQEERDEKERLARAKLHLYDQTVIPYQRNVNGYEISAINEKIVTFDPVFGIEEDFAAVKRHLQSFETYERIIHWETSKDYETLDTILADPLLLDSITNALAKGFKANLLAIDGKLQQAVKPFESALTDLKKYPEFAVLRSIWEVMYWNVQYLLEQRNPAQDILNMVQRVDPQYARNMNNIKKIGESSVHNHISRWLCLNLVLLLTKRGRFDDALSFAEKGLALSHEHGKFSELYPLFLSHKATILSYKAKVPEKSETIEKLFEYALQIASLQGTAPSPIVYMQYRDYLSSIGENDKAKQMQDKMGNVSEDKIQREEIFSFLQSGIILPFVDTPLFFEQ